MHDLVAMTQIAFTRQPAPAIAQCELTYMDRAPIDFQRALAQHQQYEDSLRAMGAEVVTAPADARCPDCVFIEDTALVLDTIAIIGRMRRDSRAPEVSNVEGWLAPQRSIERIEAPGTFEGGDAFVVGTTIFIGESTRTNAAGIDQVRSMAARDGYTVVPVKTPGCLHLTTGASRLTDETVLVNPNWVDVTAMQGVNIVETHEDEPWGANTLRLGHQTLMGDCFPRTRERLEAMGIQTRTTDISEFMKAEAGLTCMSLLFEGDVDQLRASIADVEITARPSPSRASTSA